MKKKIKIQDVSFAHQVSSSRCVESKYIEWDRSFGDTNLIFFTDQCLEMAQMPKYKKAFKVAWLLEPYVITPHIYNWIGSNHHLFDLVLTHHASMLNINKKFAWYSSGMCWVDPKDFGLHKDSKTKVASLIASEKNYAVGHMLRHHLVKHLSCQSNPKYKDNIEIAGRGYRPFENKIYLLKEYMFSFAIENSREPYYFTEKLIDCFVTGTVPIYWGCPQIEKFFNPDGMIIIESLDALKEVIDTITDREAAEDIFNRKSDAIRQNYEIAQDHLVSEDWIYKNVLEPRNIV